MDSQGNPNRIEELSLNSPVGDITDVVMRLHSLGRPIDDEACANRIDRYFSACASGQLRPGVETLCAVLCISRQTLLNWSRGIGCSRRRQEDIGRAKSLIYAVLEQMGLGGKIAPPTYIFLTKAWLGYREDGGEYDDSPVTIERTQQEILSAFNEDLLSDVESEE